MFTCVSYLKGRFLSEKIAVFGCEKPKKALKLLFLTIKNWRTAFKLCRESPRCLRKLCGKFEQLLFGASDLLNQFETKLMVLQPFLAVMLSTSMRHRMSTERLETRTETLHALCTVIRVTLKPFAVSYGSRMYYFM